MVDPGDEFNSPFIYVHNDPVNFKDKDGTFEREIHGSITGRAFLNLSGKYPNVLDKMDEVVSASMDIDPVSILGELAGHKMDFHFDNRFNFREISETWDGINVRLNNWNWKTNTTTELGIILHTVQDFYAHSNYVELYVEYHTKMHGNEPTSVPIFADGLKDDKFRTDYLQPRLRTGQFDLGPLGLGAVVNWIGNAIANLFGEGIKPGQTHGGMNKDSPAHKLHALTEDVALRQSQSDVDRTQK